MLRRRWLLLLVLAITPFTSCSSECDRCDSDDDCEQGFVCVRFENGSQRCGSGAGSTTCRTIR